MNEVAMFVAVVRAGSFALAARRLGMPPNSLSRRVQRLEDQLGTRLMQRSTRKLTLTPAGLAFYERCESAVDDIAQAGRALIDGSQVPSGLVRVAATADFLDLFPAEWIHAFLAEHPQVRIEFVLNDATVDLIDERIDVAFRAGHLKDSSLVARKLAVSCHSLVASPTYLAACGTPNTLQELASHDCLVSSNKTGRALWRLEGPAGLEEVQVSGRFGANTAGALRNTACAGLGIALLPEMLVKRDADVGRLVKVLPQYGRDGGGFYVVYPSRRQLPLAVSAFIDFVIEKLPGLEPL